MKFFLDTAEVEEINNALQSGLVDGVTTNPSLIAKSGRDFKEVVKEIAELVKGPTSAEVISTDYSGMMKEAEELIKLSEHIVIKVPLTPNGLRACYQLTQNEVKVNVTLCFSTSQALLAAKAGATYISPFIGRLDDIGQDGMQLIGEIRQLYDNYGYETQILAASIRHTEHVRQAALIGADVGTMPTKVFHQMFKHPLTELGLEQFLADWHKTKA